MAGLSGIYKIQSIVKPNRCYVGSAVDILTRWRGHLLKLRKNIHANPKLQAHFNKYGKNDLQFSILLGCDRGDLITSEQFFIDSLKPWFNICKIAGSTLGKPAHNKGIPMSEEQKVKIRAARKLQINTRKGTPHSAETKKRLSEIGKGRKLSTEQKMKISEGLKGRKCSEETRKKISAAQIGKKRPLQSGENHPMYGKSHTPQAIEKIKAKRKLQTHTRKGIPQSEETKGKIRKANLGKKMSEETKRKIGESQIRIGNKPPPPKERAPWNKGLKKIEGMSGKISKLKIA